jgi:bacteriocin-like protein
MESCDSDHSGGNRQCATISEPSSRLGANYGQQKSIRELTESELATVSGGMFKLDFGIVEIWMQFPFEMGNGPMTGATICGNNGCVDKMFGP